MVAVFPERFRATYPMSTKTLSCRRPPGRAAAPPHPREPLVPLRRRAGELRAEDRRLGRQLLLRRQPGAVRHQPDDPRALRDGVHRPIGLRQEHLPAVHESHERHDRGDAARRHDLAGRPRHQRGRRSTWCRSASASAWCSRSRTRSPSRSWRTWSTARRWRASGTRRGCTRSPSGASNAPRCGTK